MTKTAASQATAGSRRIERVFDGVRTLEGAGFEVRRPFPTRALDHIDPFLLLDEMGPSQLGPGQAKGAPDHPHRGFETVTYVLSGEMQHRDSAGNAGRIGPGDVQWMTAGAGVVHSEMPGEAIMRHGGRMHGFQLWVNLPKVDKMMRPRYQEVPAGSIPEARSADGRVGVRVIAGESLGARAVIDTRTPIMHLHFTIAPGGHVAQPVPGPWNVFAYPFVGGALAGPERRPLDEGQAAVFAAAGDEVEIAVPEDAAAPAQVLLLAGVPLREPVARYGPFVMNTRDELAQAFDDFRSGRMGQIR